MTYLSASYASLDDEAAKKDSQQKIYCVHFIIYSFIRIRGGDGESRRGGKQLRGCPRKIRQPNFRRDTEFLQLFFERQFVYVMNKNSHNLDNSAFC